MPGRTPPSPYSREALPRRASLTTFTASGKGDETDRHICCPPTGAVNTGGSGADPPAPGPPSDVPALRA